MAISRLSPPIRDLPCGEPASSKSRWCSLTGGWLALCIASTGRVAHSSPDTLHHSKVDLAMNAYDKASAEDIRAGLRVASKKLLGSDLLPKDLLPTAQKQSDTDESAA